MRNAGSSARAMTAVRLEPELKQRLEEVARINERSMSEEVRERLNRSLTFDAPAPGDFSDPETRALIGLISYSLDLVEQHTGRPWFHDPGSFKHASAAILELVSYLRPPGRSAFPEDAPVLRALRAQGLDDLAEQARQRLEQSNLGQIIGREVVALTEEAGEEGAMAKPELRRLIPYAATVRARLRANNADGQARHDMNTLVEPAGVAKP